MRWFTADQHYGHARIIRDVGPGRPFADVAEMDRELARLHNGQVHQDDVVYHLGDFALANPGRAAQYLAVLNGRHVLVRGNHDRGPAAMQDCGFVVVQEAVVTILGRRILLSHSAMLPDARPDVFGCFHGHSHGRGDKGPRNLDVGVDCCGFRPISERVAFRRLAWQIKNGRKWCNGERDQEAGG